MELVLEVRQGMREKQSMRKNSEAIADMINAVWDWICSMRNNQMLQFEQRVLDAVASRMTGVSYTRFMAQVKMIKAVHVDPFRTCFTLLQRREAVECERIESNDGLILARVIGNIDGYRVSAEIGLSKGLLYAIVTDRPLSHGDRKRKRFEVMNVELYPRMAPLSSEWLLLLDHRDELINVQTQIFKAEERWLHPWFAAWYLCLANIGSQYYIMQRCDEEGTLVLLDYIDNEIVCDKGLPRDLLLHAYAHGDWTDDMGAISGELSAIMATIYGRCNIEPNNHDNRYE